MPQIWMRFRHLSAPGAFKMDQLPTVRPIWFHTLLRNSRPSKIRRDMMYVAQNLKKYLVWEPQVLKTFLGLMAINLLETEN